MSVSCHCKICGDGIEYYVEPGFALSNVIWNDNCGILEKLGIETLQQIAVTTESSEDHEHAEIEPRRFLDWLATLVAHWEILCDRSDCDDASDAVTLPMLRRIGEHAVDACARVQAGWA